MGEVTWVVEEGPRWDAHSCLVVRREKGMGGWGWSGETGNTFPEMKWPKMVIPSGGVARGGEPEATGRILIAKSSIID